VGVDEFRIEFGEDVIPQPEFLHRPDREVLDDDVRFRGELLEQLLASVGFEVQRDAVLAGVQHDQLLRLPFVDAGP